MGALRKGWGDSVTRQLLLKEKSWAPGLAGQPRPSLKGSRLGGLTVVSACGEGPFGPTLAVPQLNAKPKMAPTGLKQPPASEKGQVGTYRGGRKGVHEPMHVGKLRTRSRTSEHARFQQQGNLPFCPTKEVTAHRLCFPATHL